MRGKRKNGYRVAPRGPSTVRADHASAIMDQLNQRGRRWHPCTVRKAIRRRDLYLSALPGI